MEVKNISIKMERYGDRGWIWSQSFQIRRWITREYRSRRRNSRTT